MLGVERLLRVVSRRLESHPEGLISPKETLTQLGREASFGQERTPKVLAYP